MATVVQQPQMVWLCSRTRMLLLLLLVLSEPAGGVGGSALASGGRHLARQPITRPWNRGETKYRMLPAPMPAWAAQKGPRHEAAWQ